MIIKGDNLEALKALLPYYKGQVKCIYIDPPYNTGSAFEHYDDNLEHSTWLSMMYPRLELLRELLAENGSIWISIDDDEQAYLKVICDEIFGRKNFVNNVVWQKKYSPANDTRWLSDNHDFIIVYAKNKNLWEPNLLPRSDTMNARYKNIDNDPRGLWKPCGFSVKTYTKEYDYSITTPTGRIVYPPSGSCWQTSKENYEKKLADNRIYFGKNGDSKPQIKQFLYEVQQGMVSKTIWLYDEVGHNQIAKKEVQILNAADVFATPKPERLIERVLTLGSNPGDLVLDSFLGSGTTAAVAQKIGRRYIGIEMGEHAITHAAPRLKKVIDGEQGGGGFTFYDMGEAIFDEKGNINKRIDFKSLAFHIWFSETKTAMREYKKSPLLGVFDNAVYYLLDNGILGDKKVNGGNVLTSKIFEILPKPDNRKHKKVIYGEACRLSSDKLRKENITFKQTPYDIKAG
ncbi:site-specific DNA-methyltransferase [Candidatus Endomicrobiellum trichonymphae]|uniref:site-specific DNA-methyltransferase n=1 Tax=Endomicrobium trichonymphae TaxID=1408204 RepID=UPI000322E397|nr:site-specific DNA-methyltransferase [Candidatus Endomicrobium trichonymphae]